MSTTAAALEQYCRRSHLKQCEMKTLLARNEAPRIRAPQPTSVNRKEAIDLASRVLNTEHNWDARETVVGLPGTATSVAIYPVLYPDSIPKDLLDYLASMIGLVIPGIDNKVALTQDGQLLVQLKAIAPEAKPGTMPNQQREKNIVLLSIPVIADNDQIKLVEIAPFVGSAHELRVESESAIETQKYANTAFRGKMPQGFPPLPPVRK